MAVLVGCASERQTGGGMRIGCIGEAMIELAVDRRPEQIGYSGDVFNTAVYLARGLGPAHEVNFVSVIGCDPMSDRMAAFIAAQGVGTADLARHPARQPGLYAITTDAAGERSFTYWREASAARTLFADGFGMLAGYDVIYLSAITLAILPPAVRAGLIGALARFPGRVAFDSNYRPRLWEDAAAARAAVGALWGLRPIALPSLDDEMALFGDGDEATVLARLRGLGLREGALKRGARGPVALDPGTPDRDFAPAARVVDTTAAGDSFNGAFLAAHLTGAPTAEALALGHAQALAVIAVKGAIIAPSDHLRE